MCSVWRGEPRRRPGGGAERGRGGLVSRALVTRGGGRPAGELRGTGVVVFFNWGRMRPNVTHV